MFPSIGTGELLIVVIVALVVLGPKRLPAFIRSAAKIYKYIKKTAAEVTTSINEAMDDSKDIIKEGKDSLSDYFDDIEDFDDADIEKIEKIDKKVDEKIDKKKDKNDHSNDTPKD